MTINNTSERSRELPDLAGAGWLVSLDCGEVWSQFSLRGSIKPSSIARSEAKDCTVVFDGALYSALSLDEAIAAPAENKTSPAEQILRAYLEMGEGVLQKIKGVFALIIWDGRSRVLLCARDRLGVYPLFYARAGRHLFFSTSTESLTRRPEVSAEVNRAALADHLCHRWPSLEETFLANVNRIPPGHAMRVAGDNLCVFRYWDPAPRGEIDWVREDELDEFDRLLNQAVERCSAQGRSAIFLSGGFDSVSIAAFAAATGRAKGTDAPLALSVIFPDPDCNEEVVQRGVARTLGLKHILLGFDQAVSPRGFLGSALEMSARLSAPLLNVYGPAYYRLGLEGKRHGCKVIMTGGGGDEWLAVSPYYAADLFRNLDLAGLYRLWKHSQRSYPLPLLTTLHNVLWRFGARPLLGKAARKLLRRSAPSLLRARQRSSFSIPSWVAPDPELSKEIKLRREREFDQPEADSFYIWDMRRALDHPLVSWEMEEIFETSRRMEVAMLQPYWDAELIELLYRVPPELLNRGGRSKGLVRQTVARRFPELGFERHKKVVATNFFASRCRVEGAAARRAMGGAVTLAKLGIVEYDKLDSTIATALARDQFSQSYRIWDTLNLESWCRPRC
jgi:asparagine synthase (glutamine-hydrolysing)